jgi:hypothetical protein
MGERWRRREDMAISGTVWAGKACDAVDALAEFIANALNGNVGSAERNGHNNKRNLEEYRREIQQDSPPSKKMPIPWQKRFLEGIENDGIRKVAFIPQKRMF